ncbi:AtzE family amidohydrolase [Leptolyngbya sp. FACHB-17]|uniref:AtzE family amidohydrolase n=1 Tax=unclassified Leptolyngbya TaxID=2650499 RepID=UPI0016805667|nr:AtzE family amidohydrolase [Leptolyngbya sp. FACHB-17]MBD2083155.1 AtzE family amidohydrolase [Leptolyngbya sp. FACHB-17]
MNIPDATQTAIVVRSREVTAKSVTAAALAQIAEHNQTYNCFTTVLSESALEAADRIDQKIAAGEDPGALAGVPFAVKDLFDVAGIPTFAGSKINAEKPPATQDAALIKRLKGAGAVLVGALNMDEFAYGFTTENAHYGATRNPHDLGRSAGGSSGGSAAAIAAGLVPFSLGSDTNGSIRVPASFCGIFGLKPTYGRLSRAGAYPFVGSLDHVGPFARSVRDLALLFDVMQGHDPSDPVCTARSPEFCLPELSKGSERLRIAIADDYFARGGEPEVFAAVEQVAQALGVTRRITLPASGQARAAAFVITATEGANLHFEELRTRPQDFDFAVRDRLLAGALVPGHWYVQAQRFRQWFRDQVREIFQEVDIILAPATPCAAPRIGQQTMTLDGQEMLVRPNLGMFTQPLSFIGLPIVSVPVKRSGLPLGVQIIAAPYQEALVLRVAAELEAKGIVEAPVVDR